FPVYSLAVAHLNDYIADDLKVAVGSKLILVNGIGAIAGPIVGSVAIGVWSPESLFLVLAVGYVVVLAGTLYRITKRSESEEAVRARFVPVAVGVGPVGVGVGDHGEGEFAELVRGVVTFATAEVHYVECGSGPSIVLIGDATGPAGDVADGLIGPLVADGFHVVMPLLGSGHVPDDAVGAVLEVLRAVSVPAATFVGVDSGVDVIRRVAEHRADRTHALVAIADVRPPDADGTHGDDAHPMLWLPRRALVESPEDAADDIAEFVRPIVAAMSVQWETGRFDVIDPERPDATSTT
ncbi:MAG: hypothetical protein JST73_06115, partial [Actinobacteria bacterium]|nr:hypothetical protein [Actinomycetota bacterium]